MGQGQIKKQQDSVEQVIMPAVDGDFAFGFDSDFTDDSKCNDLFTSGKSDNINIAKLD